MFDPQEFFPTNENESDAEIQERESFIMDLMENKIKGIYDLDFSPDDEDFPHLMNDKNVYYVSTHTFEESAEDYYYNFAGESFSQFSTIYLNNNICKI